jgi:hypothetical protein
MRTASSTICGSSYIRDIIVSTVFIRGTVDASARKVSTMPRINLNNEEIFYLIDSLNDSILRSSSTLKIKRLTSLKERIWSHRTYDEPEIVQGQDQPQCESVEQEESVRVDKKRKKQTP